MLATSSTTTSILLFLGSLASLPRDRRMSKQTTLKLVPRWRCDVCHERSFLTLEEAWAHEDLCGREPQKRSKRPCASSERKRSSSSTSGRSEKKRAKASPKKKPPPAHIDESLNPFAIPDLVDCIKPFLSIRDLFHFAMCSKTLMNSITYDDVIGSAIRSGGKSMNVMGNTARLVREDKIYVPSILRLLRLCNGIYCETPGCRSRIKVYPQPGSEDYGIHMCRRCLAGWNHMFRYKYGHYSRRNARIFDHPRLSGRVGEWTATIFARQYRDSTGEHAGPVLSHGDQFKEDVDELLRNRDAHHNPHKQHAASIVEAKEQMWC